MLDLHRDLRCKAVLRPVQMRSKGHTIVVDVRQSGLALGDHVVVLEPVGVHSEDLLEADAERHHLETAAIGERRTCPVHEGAEAAGSLDHVCAGLQVEVVRVRQDCLSTKCRQALR